MSAASRTCEWLTVHDLADRFGISRSAAYRLSQRLPSYRLPGIGVRFKLSDVEAFEGQFRREPVAGRGSGAARRIGMRVASDDDQVVIDGLTRRQLKEKAGF